MVFLLLLGIAMAAVLFAACLWCGYRAYLIPTRVRWFFAATSALIIAGMGVISWSGTPEMAAMLGGILCAVALVAAGFERGWPRLFPLAAVGFGVILILGLPFAGQ